MSRQARYASTFNRRETPPSRRLLVNGHYIREKTGGEVLREAWSLVMGERDAEAKPNALFRLAHSHD